MKRTQLIAAWSRQIVVLTTLFLSSAAAASAPQHGIFMRWYDGNRAIVIGTLQIEDTDPDVDHPAAPQYFVEIESAIVGELEAGQSIPLRTAYATGRNGLRAPLPIGEKSVLLMARPKTPRTDGDGRIWSISGGGYDFMGTEGTPFCRLGPEADMILRDIPGMIRISELARDSGADWKASQREAVWEEWRKGQMRRSLILGWIIELSRDDPAHEPAMLNFLADLVNDRNMPPECRLTADSHLASPTVNRPDYANNTPARTALLIELLAHPDFPEHERKQAERTLGNLTQRLEAEKNTAAPAPGPSDAQNPD